MRNTIFQTNSFRNTYQNLINEINLFEDHLKTLSDSELRAKNFKLKLQYKTKQTSLTKKNPTIKNLKKSKYYKENITKIDKTTIKELNKININ